MAMKIDSALHDENKLGNDLINIGDGYEKLDDLDSALLYTQQGYELVEKLHNIDSRAIALNNLGNIFSKMGKPVPALESYRHSISDAVAENDDYDLLCESMLGMASLFRRAGNADSALYYARLSLEKASKGGFTSRIMNASEFLTSFYKSIHNIDSAFAYQQVTLNAKDSIFSQEKVKQVQNLSFEESIRQQELAMQKRKEADNATRNLQLIGIAIFIPILFLIILLLARIKVKARVVEFLSIINLLLLFEFLTDLIFPYISDWTNDRPVWEMLILVGIAALLEPLNYRIERWVKSHLVHRALLGISVELPISDNS